MTSIDAQEITFNQDPEASATDDIEPTEKTNNCCCKLICCPCNLFYWYIAPITCEFCHTLKCFLFHPINFGMAIFLITWDCTMLSLGIGLIALCCMGIPLLWVSIEFIIAFSRIDLGLNYYMVEDGKKLDKSREYLLTLSLYFTDIPLCCCYDQRDNHENCLNLMFERMKHLFTNIQIYKYILYHILIRPVITFSTWWIMICVAVNVGLVGLPIWYAVHDTLFVENKIYFGWRHDCSLPNDGRDGIVCDEDYVWIINTFGRALGVAIISLVILPLMMRLNNWFAYLNKIVAYKLYTFYYTDDMEKIQGSAPILNNNDRIDSV